MFVNDTSRIECRHIFIDTDYGLLELRSGGPLRHPGVLRMRRLAPAGGRPRGARREGRRSAVLCACAPQGAGPLACVSFVVTTCTPVKDGEGEVLERSVRIHTPLPSRPKRRVNPVQRYSPSGSAMSPVRGG